MVTPQEVEPSVSAPQSDARQSNSAAQEDSSMDAELGNAAVSDEAAAATERPVVFKKNAGRQRCGTCLSPTVAVAFICGVLATMAIMAIARDPIETIATQYLCPADGDTLAEGAGIQPAVPAAPEFLPKDVVSVLESLQADLGDLVSHIVSGRRRGGAYNFTAEFVDKFGHRQAGSASLEMSLDFLKDQLEAWNFTVEQNFLEVPRWVRGNETCQIVVPLVGGSTRKLEILGLGFSVGTQNFPDGVLEAEIVVVESLDELAERSEELPGKIVVFNMRYRGYGSTRPYRTHAASFAAKLDAVGLLLRSVCPFSLNSPHAGSMSYRKEALDRTSADDMGFGPGAVPDLLLGDYSGVPEIPAAAITVEDAAMLRRMELRGETVRVRLKMEAREEGTSKTRNIMTDIVGSENADEVVVVSGHIDSWDVGQGALDDAGPSFTALQTLLAVKDLDLKPRRTLRMIFWTAEEIGSLGGKAYFDSHELPVENLAMAVELDSGIFNPSGVLLRGDDMTIDIAKWVGSKILLDVGGHVYPSPKFSTADMYFWLAKSSEGSGGGIPALTIAHLPATEHAVRVDGGGGPDTVWPADWQGDYFFYHHTNADTMQILDTRQMDRAAAIVAAHAYVFASLPAMPSRGTLVPEAQTAVAESCYRYPRSAKCIPYSLTPGRMS